MISIGIPFYNAAAYLEDAIKSVLAQTFKEWELILIDDGSSDGSLDIAKRYEQLDARVRVLSDGLNKKLPARLNQIISESKFDYIARMDADDIMDIDRLKIQMNFLIKNSNIDIIGSSIYSIDNNNKIIGKRIIVDSISLDTLLLGNNQIVHPSILAKKSWYLRNRYDESAERAEDYELWLRSSLNKDLNIHILQEPLIFYRELGNLTKDKLLLSYKTSSIIFSKLKGKIPLLVYLKAKLFLFFKKQIVNQLFLYGAENLLAKRRNNTNLSEHELKLANSKLLQAVSFNE